MLLRCRCDSFFQIVFCLTKDLLHGVFEKWLWSCVRCMIVILLPVTLKNSRMVNRIIKRSGDNVIVVLNGGELVLRTLLLAVGSVEIVEMEIRVIHQK